MFLLIILSIFVAVCFYNFYYKRRNFPPGPTPLPLLGNVLSFLTVNCSDEIFTKWRKKFGNVYTIWLSEVPMVVLADFEAIQETIQKDGDSYTGRVELENFHKYINGGVYGIANTDGDVWREHRRFALHTLRDFGLGKNVMQDRVLDEVTHIVSTLKTKISNGNKDEEYDVIEDVIDVSVGSIINSILFGYRFCGEKLAEYRTLSTLLRNFFAIFTNPLMFLTAKNPKLFSKIPLIGGAVRGFKRSSDELFNFFYQQIDEHRNSIDFETDSTPTDFVEAYLREAYKRDKEGINHTFSIKQLSGICWEMWLAGQESTTTTLAWALAYIITHPKVQDQLHQELDKVVGSTDRLVTISDKQNLHFTNAVISEVQRIANIVPFVALARVTTREVNIGSTKLDKGVGIIPQISCVLFDDKLFPEPLKFNPNRFIDENGRFKKCNELIPFSIGKRQCLGESLARMELFLFITNLFNSFKFLPGATSPNLTRRRGFIVTPDKFKCRIEIR